MRLFLASEVKNPSTAKKLEEYIGGFKGKKIVYIPTAGNGEGWGSWKSGGSWKLAQLELVDFDIYPHFKDEHLGEIKNHYKGKKLYLLKDGEEIIVEDQKITVIGEERIVTGKK